MDKQSTKKRHVNEHADAVQQPDDLTEWLDGSTNGSRFGDRKRGRVAAYLHEIPGISLQYW